MRYARIDTAAMDGTIPSLVTVEASVYTPQPGTAATVRCLGLSERTFHANQTRVRSALANSALRFPTGAVTVNVATPLRPSHMPPFAPSDPSALDLALAVAILCADGALPTGRIGGMLLMAELGLDGSLRPVPGVRPALAHAAREGFTVAVVAPVDAEKAAGEAAKVPRLTVLAPSDLATFAAWLHGQADLQSVPGSAAFSGLVDRVPARAQARPDAAGEVATHRPS